MHFFRDTVLPLAGALVISGGLIYLFASSFERIPRKDSELQIDPQIPAPDEVTEIVEPKALVEPIQPPAATAVDHSADIAAWNALKRNCQQATLDNASGEYPALQQMACNRFAQFAASKGWDTGPLPATVVAPERSRQVVTVIHHEPAPIEPGECVRLRNEKSNIDAIMRQGYQEPLGNHYRARLHEIDLQIWRLKCLSH